MCVCCLSAWEREPFNLWSEQGYASVRPPYPRHCRCRVHNLLNVTVSSGKRGWRSATPPPEERDRQRTREKQGSIGALMPVRVCVWVVCVGLPAVRCSLVTLASCCCCTSFILFASDTMIFCNHLGEYKKDELLEAARWVHAFSTFPHVNTHSLMIPFSSSLPCFFHRHYFSFVCAHGYELRHVSEKVPSGPGMSQSMDAFNTYMWWPGGAHFLHRGQPESFHLAACHGQNALFHVVNSVLIGFRVLQVKPEEKDAKETTSHPTCCLGKLHFTKHLIVTIAMEKQDCLLKHVTRRQSQQSPPFRYREKMFLFILWSTSPLALPPFLYPCLQAQPTAWIRIRTLVFF